MAASNKTMSKKPSMKLAPPVNEEDWVIQIQKSIVEEIEDEDIKTPVSIFCVPPSLASCKPEAYVPQLFAFGPYHHWRTHLYDMERYKLSAARSIHARLSANNLKFDDIVEKFKKKEYKIRCHYHKQLDLNTETLAWMMAIDSSFLLQFLQNFYAGKQGEAVQVGTPKTISKRIEMERIKVGFGMILRDMTMLENQLPLFLLKMLLKFIYSSKEIAEKERSKIAEEELSKMLIEFVKELSPFKKMDDARLNTVKITHHHHLLELLYCIIVPKPKELPRSEIDNETADVHYTDGEADQSHVIPPEELGDPTVVRRVINWVWSVLSSINGGPIRFIKRVLFSAPVKFLAQFPWKVITALPVLSIIKAPVENFLTNLILKPKSDEEQSPGGPEKPPLVEEITIPSVTELVSAGVKFKPTKDIKTIKFDTKKLTMHLPVINLDVNTEVILRNLVAYEASAVSGPMVFTRYAELMFGIIDTEEDVRILRSRKIVVNRMKSDKEAAELWNGMSRSVKLSKVGFLDKTIGDVNKYYRSRWKVKCRYFMRKYIFGSWQILTFLAAGLLLFLTCVQSFCTVYSCSAHLTMITNMGENSDAGASVNATKPLFSFND